MTTENQINKKRKCKFCRKTITDKRLIPFTIEHIEEAFYPPIW